MNKDSNIRVFKRDRSLLRKIAKEEGRTLKAMFGMVMDNYKNWHDMSKVGYTTTGTNTLVFPHGTKSL